MKMCYVYKTNIYRELMLTQYSLFSLYSSGHVVCDMTEAHYGTVLKN